MMNKSGGYAGNILYVDLSKGEIEKKPFDLDLAKNYIGGLGASVKLAYDLLRPGTDPLSPENVMVIGVGPMVGTLAPGSSRVCAVTKLPVNHAIGWAGAGGCSFGCMLKNAGYDHVVIRGRSPKPVYLKIFDDDIELRDAEWLWGKGVEQTTEELWKEYGRPTGVIAIGQAGENLVKFSMAFVDKTSTLGRGGLGAVMGSKNLKAIVVKGTKGVGFSDTKFVRLCSELLERIKRHPRLREWQELGLLVSFPVLPREVYLERLKRARISCVSCPIGDKDVIQIREGRFKGLVKFTSSVVNAVMPMLYGLPYDEAIKCVAVLDDYGMDMFEFFAVIETVNRLYDKGVIARELLESKIEYSYESLVEWAGRIAHRRGFGDVLAEGLAGLVEKFGREVVARVVPVVKGLTAYVGPRGPVLWNRFGTMEFGQLVNPRGPHVASSGSPTYFAVRPLQDFATHLKRMGVPDDAVSRILPRSHEWPRGLQSGLVSSSDEAGLNVGRLTRYSEDWFMVLASLGVCARAQINRFYSAKLAAELFSALTGMEMDERELMKCGERTWNLLRAANAREGFSRKDDEPPESWFVEPTFVDYCKGTVKITKEIVDMFLDDYYEERGWNKDGVPTREKLLELGLEKVLEDLEKLGLTV
jgi:aldehyde:ferredoxin oxidoreductase